MGKKYLGKENAQELAGAAVILKRDVSNGMGAMPKGSQGVITNCPGYVKDGKLGFQANKCHCCGFQWRVGGLRYADLELMTEPRFTPEQKEWCDNYEARTGFEPLMDDYVAGNESFIAAAKRSVRWFEDHASDAMRRIGNIPGIDNELISPASFGNAES